MLANLSQLQFVKKKNIYSITGKFIQFSGDFVDRVTPVPIPNTEVKPVRADDTAPFRCGKVGSRRIYNLEKSLLGNEQAFLRSIKTWTTFLPKAIIKLGKRKPQSDEFRSIF